MLRKHFKLGKGDVVAVYLPNCPDYLIACLGTLSGGLVITTVNALYTAGKYGNFNLLRYRLILFRGSI